MNQQIMRRTKVYKLNEAGLWDDKGTGHVSVEYMEQSHSVGLVVISEEDTRTLLIHKISPEDIYQRQGEDTIITWSDSEIGTDIALSFQEAPGCNYIWAQILQVQEEWNRRKRGSENALRRTHAIDEFEQVSASLEGKTLLLHDLQTGDYPDASTAAPIGLPEPEMANLEMLGKILAEYTPFQREPVTAQMLQPTYVRKLLDVFRVCEDLEDKENLVHLYHIMRGAIMLNDTSLFEVLLAEENVMDVVGALEYDPELPTQQHHRDFLRDHVVFKEVVPITDPLVRAKIHQTYRMGYLKDVILPRVLDDGTFATLSSLMLFNNVEVLQSLQADPRFFPELFNRLSSTKSSYEGWADLVAFLQELCGLAKHLQNINRAQLLTKLVELGLFQVMTDVMSKGDETLRLRATDVIISAVQHDPAPMRGFLLKQKDHKLLSTMMNLLVSGQDGGLQEQVLEILRCMLDPESMEQSPEKNEFLDMFYQKYLGTLVDILATPSERNGSIGKGPSASTMALVVDLLCFCVHHHAYRIKYYVLKNGVVEKVLRLLQRREQWLVVAAVRFLRTCIGLKDEFYNRYLTRNKLFEPIIAAFLDNGDRYNLLNSAVLELVEFIRRENIKSLVEHLVDNFYHRLEDIDYVETFHNLKVKYDQGQERVTSGAGTSPSRTAAARDAMKQARHRRDERALDRDEEDYFNEADEDEEGGAPPAIPNASSIGNGVGRPAPLPSLVDYDDDDDADEDGFTGHKHGLMHMDAPNKRTKLGDSQLQVGQVGSPATWRGGSGQGSDPMGLKPKRFLGSP